MLLPYNVLDNVVRLGTGYAPNNIRARLIINLVWALTNSQNK